MVRRRPRSYFPTSKNHTARATGFACTRSNNHAAVYKLAEAATLTRLSSSTSCCHSRPTRLYTARRSQKEEVRAVVVQSVPTVATATTAASYVDHTAAEVAMSSARYHECQPNTTYKHRCNLDSSSAIPGFEGYPGAMSKNRDPKSPSSKRRRGLAHAATSYPRAANCNLFLAGKVNCT